MVDAQSIANNPSQNLSRAPHKEISNPSDPIFPWLCSIKEAAESFCRNPETSAYLRGILEDCIGRFENEDRYQEDPRFLHVWLLYADAIQDFGKVFKMLEENNRFQSHALLYWTYALSLEAKGHLEAANATYKLGISRNAEPLENLQRMHNLFLKRVQGIVDAWSLQKAGIDEIADHGDAYVNPWSMSTINDLLAKMDHQIRKYEGYHRSTKAFSKKVPLSSLRNSSRNKIIELGGVKYQIKGCSGKGAFAQVFKAHMDSNPDDVVALKIQSPAFPWEFYMYRQLDKRIPDDQRTSFGFACKVHIYADCSILVCDYVDHGTFQDVINSYLVIGQTMEEVICIYYTIEMLQILETLHNVGIIHGDFKSDNLLVRYTRDGLSEDGFHSREGSWRDQGLCLVDWGRGIDLTLFPNGTEFKGDCRTSCFRCVEMLENRPWKFQVDTYGLCVIVHMMLHGTYMTIKKKVEQDGSCIYEPKSPLKRYWNADLWNSLFTKLLNSNSGSDVTILRGLRQSFEGYMRGNPQLIKKLKMLLVRQRDSLCKAV